MKFKLAASHRYWWPVKVRIPVADLEQAGAIEEQELRVQFEPQSRDEAVAAARAYERARTTIERGDLEIAQLKAVTRDWDGVVDETGKPVAFSPEALDMALQTSWFRVALFTAHTQSLNGEEARLGN